MKINSYKDLIVWQKSFDLVMMVYKITERFPKHELYGLTSQIRRSSVSIPSNIAEGCARYYTGEYIQFLKIALGSAAELETQLLIAEKLNYSEKSKIKEIFSLLTEIIKMLNVLINKLKLITNH